MKATTKHAIRESKRRLSTSAASARIMLRKLLRRLAGEACRFDVSEADAK